MRADGLADSAAAVEIGQANRHPYSDIRKLDTPIATLAGEPLTTAAMAVSRGDCNQSGVAGWPTK